MAASGGSKVTYGAKYAVAAAAADDDDCGGDDCGSFLGSKV